MVHVAFYVMNVIIVQTTLTAALTIIARLMDVLNVKMKALIVQRTMNAAKTTNA